MRDQDEAANLSNPKIIAAVYFGVFSILLTFVLNAILYAFGLNQILPLYQATLLAVVIAVAFGTLFAHKTVLSQGAYLKKSFLWAVLMTICALLVYDVGFLGLMALNTPQAFDDASLLNIMQLYCMIVVYSFVFVGWWLAILAGLAAMYLRGYLVYFILRSL